MGIALDFQVMMGRVMGIRIWRGLMLYFLILAWKHGLFMDVSSDYKVKSHDLSHPTDLINVQEVL